MPNILAIAVGDPSNSHQIANPGDVTGARPYVRGLVDYLLGQNIKIGRDYTIDYQECYEGDEAFTPADVIFCMSTPVVRKARAFTSTMLTPTPIVGVFSDPRGEGFDRTQNICGVIAHRIANGRQYYERFIHAVSGLSAVYILHRTGNTASKGALDNLRQGSFTVPIATLDVALAPNHDIATLINGVPRDSGLLVFPVDVFFGAKTSILQLAQARSLRVFWPTPDGVPSGITSYGVPQYDCGELMGAQVEYIFAHPNQIPQGGARFVQAPNPKWVASKAVANALNVELREHRELSFV